MFCKSFIDQAIWVECDGLKESLYHGCKIYFSVTCRIKEREVVEQSSNIMTKDLGAIN